MFEFDRNLVPAVLQMSNLLEVGYTPGHFLLFSESNFEWKSTNSMAYLPGYPHDY